MWKFLFGEGLLTDFACGRGISSLRPTPIGIVLLQAIIAPESFHLVFQIPTFVGIVTLFSMILTVLVRVLRPWITSERSGRPVILPILGGDVDFFNSRCDGMVF